MKKTYLLFSFLAVVFFVEQNLLDAQDGHMNRIDQFFLESISNLHEDDLFQIQVLFP